MNFSDEPATWKQLRILNRCGYQLSRRLTKDEASQLISNFRGEPQVQTVLEATAVVGKTNAYPFRMSAENATGAPGGHGENAMPNDPVSAKTERQEFWLSTCRGTAKIQAGSKRVLELYRTHGCLFCEPTLKQIQDILDALDSAMPRWEKEHPELFYQALKLNFPELVRHQ